MAASSHACFLGDAPGTSPLDLESEIDLLLRTFQEDFKERVLRPLAEMFDLGDYTGGTAGLM